MNTAILFDTSSIQQYVFGSNKLKDNIGASYIVDKVYEYLEKQSNAFEIGYIGGGNALLFTTDEVAAKKIIREYTTELLWKYPGVSVAVAIQNDFDRNDYPNSIKNLFRTLAANKGKYHPANTLSSHGITDVCRFSSLSVVQIDTYGNPLSSVTVAKRINEEKASDEEEKLLQDAQLDEKYTFPDELDHLGQKKGEDSHIAVVHIDGNGFGNVFRNLSLEKTQTLSKELKEAVRQAFIHVLNSYDTKKEELKYLLNIMHKKGKELLPIRPIVLGGDDVTFVCHGKLGIWFAERFMESFNNNTYLDNDNIEQPYSSCAGIAIVKTKYPFYRAYQLAEELCHSAKKQNKDNGGNWIDFQLAYSGLGNVLDEIRSIHYKDTEGNNLHSRPFQSDNASGKQNFKELCKNAGLLKQTLPNSKIKDLREMLTRDTATRKAYIEHLQHQHNGIDSFKEIFYKSNDAQICLNEHPFFDMIELLELYPTNLLNE